MDAHSHNYYHKPDLRDLAENLGNVSVPIIPLQWIMIEAVESFKLHPNYFFLLHIKGVWAPFHHVMEVLMDAHSHHYHLKPFPRFERLGWNPSPRWCKRASNSTMMNYGWGRRAFQTTPHIHLIRSIWCLSTLSPCGGWAHRYTLTPLPSEDFSQIWETWLKP